MEPLNEHERAELERLRSHVGRKHGRWRAVVSSILIVLGSILVLLSVAGVWASNEISDTDRYVENVTPLASDPAVQNAVANRATTEIMKYLDVPGIVDQIAGALNLPPKLNTALDGLAAPLASGVSTFVHNTVDKVVTSDAFTTFWVNANKVAHTQLDAILSGEGSATVKVSGDTVSIDLGPLIDRVKQELVSSGLTIAGSIPEIHPTFELFQTDDLYRYQTLYQWLNTLRWALPVLALVLLAAGVYLARNHRRALVGVGLGVALAMLVLAAALALTRAGYLNAVSARALDRAAAASIFDTLVRFLKGGVRMLLVLGLVVAGGAFLTGASATAVTLRDGCARGIGKIKGDLDLPWVRRYRRVIQIGLVAVAALVFVFWDQPTGMVVLWIALGLLAALAVVEYLGREPVPNLEPS